MLYYFNTEKVLPRITILTLSACVTVIKSIRKPFKPTPEISRMMETFRLIVNDCIRIGLLHDANTKMTLAALAYEKLSCYDMMYKLCAVSHAAGILANRKKSIKRKLQPRQPYARRPFLVSCYGFKVKECGTLKISIGGRRYYHIPLDSYTRNVLFNTSFRIRSFTLTPDSLSICYSKEVEEIECRDALGIDRNLRNVTGASSDEVTQYDLSKAVDIAENTRSIMRSFRRNGFRIKKRLYREYGLRREKRVDQMLHKLTKTIVQQAKRDKHAIAFEDIRHIRQLYRKGNHQGRSSRSRLNGWSFAEVKRQIEYKAKWEGVPVIQLSMGETRGTSQLCPQCGKKITQVNRKTREVWCVKCKKWMDRDIVAAMNIASKGLARFASSKGLAGEAMVQESGRKEPVILRVDASKLICRLRR